MSDTTGGREVVVATRFRGPPLSGNGGYVSGLMAAELGERVTTAVLRAPVPLDTPMALVRDPRAVRLMRGESLVGEARAGDPAELPPFRDPPSLETARRAGEAFVGLTRPFHPVCFTCGDIPADVGCRVFVGQLEAAEPGVVAGLWTPHESQAGADGLAPTEVVWAAIDCPGSVAWVEQGAGGGLLGTMTGEVLRRPGVGEACIVLAWPIERSGRKQISAVALYAQDGEPLARARQIWIGRMPQSPE
ncbi:MAG TPA: hypothetical protein VG248_15810 [Caulobacteraceae bacterium]|jgi:hypothetical protein|nr:hypothetical protein [Caulobacteraceae bacterium]